MNDERKSRGRIFWGLLLTVLGVVLLLDRMGRLDFGDLIGRYWPVVFILIGISILLSNNLKNVGSGIFFILFGTFFLLLRLRIFDQAVWRYLWPVAIIAVGLWILLRPAFHPDKKKIPELTGDDLSINQVFSGTARKVESQSFRGGHADVVFGSAEIDLRSAKLAGGQATLVLSVVLGSIEVAVPREWQVVLEGTPILGSIESRKAAAPDSLKTGTLYIKGSAVLGSIEVKE
jgi:predicted membrane protein